MRKTTVSNKHMYVYTNDIVTPKVLEINRNWIVGALDPSIKIDYEICGCGNDVDADTSTVGVSMRPWRPRAALELACYTGHSKRFITPNIAISNNALTKCAEIFVRATVDVNGDESYHNMVQAFQDAENIHIKRIRSDTTRPIEEFGRHELDYTMQLNRWVESGWRTQTKKDHFERTQWAGHFVNLLIEYAEQVAKSDYPRGFHGLEFKDFLRNRLLDERETPDRRDEDGFCVLHRGTEAKTEDTDRDPDIEYSGWHFEKTGNGRLVLVDSIGNLVHERSMASYRFRYDMLPSEEKKKLLVGGPYHDWKLDMNKLTITDPVGRRFSLFKSSDTDDNYPMAGSDVIMHMKTRITKAYGHFVNDYPNQLCNYCEEKIHPYFVRDDRAEDKVRLEMRPDPREPKDPILYLRTPIEMDRLNKIIDNERSRINELFRNRRAEVVRELNSTVSADGYLSDAEVLGELDSALSSYLREIGWTPMDIAEIYVTEHLIM